MCTVWSNHLGRYVGKYWKLGNVKYWALLYMKEENWKQKLSDRSSVFGRTWYDPQLLGAHPVPNFGLILGAGQLRRHRGRLVEASRLGSWQYSFSWLPSGCPPTPRRCWRNGRHWIRLQTSRWLGRQHLQIFFFLKVAHIESVRWRVDARFYFLFFYSMMSWSCLFLPTNCPESKDFMQWYTTEKSNTRWHFRSL